MMTILAIVLMAILGMIGMWRYTGWRPSSAAGGVLSAGITYYNNIVQIAVQPLIHLLSGTTLSTGEMVYLAGIGVFVLVLLTNVPSGKAIR